MENVNYKGKSALVVGLGISGRSAAYFLLKKGAVVTGVDRNANQLQDNPEVISLKEAGLTVALDHEQNIQSFDLVIISPGIPLTHPIYAEAIRLKKPIWGEIELGCRSVKNPIVGITGTNGKTTVTLLVTHVLNHSGKKARALGNVGIPFTKEILSVDPQEILVLELSSFQLETLSQPVLDTGVVLNITPDHLDRYANMEAYASAKLALENCLKKGCHFYIEDRADQDFGYLLKNHLQRTYGYSSNHSIYTDCKAVYAEGLKVFLLPSILQGKASHDLENLMAAYGLCRDMGVQPEQFLKALQTFKKPPHRIEFVLEKNGVKYFDDSKGTNIDAVIRAVNSLNGTIILIAGGVDKGSAYTPWLEAFADRVKCICAIGQAANKIQEQLSHRIPVQIFSTLEQAVNHAEALARHGDIVLLSPGCSSFDMFKDYAHRGEEFQRIVKRKT